MCCILAHHDHILFCFTLRRPGEDHWFPRFQTTRLIGIETPCAFFDTLIIRQPVRVHSRTRWPLCLLPAHTVSHRLCTLHYGLTACAHLCGGCVNERRPASTLGSHARHQNRSASNFISAQSVTDQRQGSTPSDGLISTILHVLHETQQHRCVRRVWW